MMGLSILLGNDILELSIHISVSSRDLGIVNNAKVLCCGFA